MFLKFIRARSIQYIITFCCSNNSSILIRRVHVNVITATNERNGNAQISVRALSLDFVSLLAKNHRTRDTRKSSDVYGFNATENLFEATNGYPFNMDELLLNMWRRSSGRRNPSRGRCRYNLSFLGLEICRVHSPRNLARRTKFDVRYWIDCDVGQARHCGYNVGSVRKYSNALSSDDTQARKGVIQNEMYHNLSHCPAKPIV